MYKLSDFTNCANFKVVIDGEFSEIGMVDHDLPNMLSIYYDNKFLKKLNKNQRITAVITTPELVYDLKKYSIAISNNPIESYYKIHNYLYKNTRHFGEEFETTIGTNCILGENAIIPNKNVVIGNNCVIEDFVTIYENTIIGNNVKIASGTRVGCIGFETKFIAGQHMIIPHAGKVFLNDNVEICANCTIARGLGRVNTVIGESCKIDTLVHVAHGVNIGSNVLLASGVTVSGSVKIGNNVWVGPSATISNGIQICNNAKITIGSTVIKDVESHGHVTGYFAINHKDFIKQKYKISKI